jgi:hypothetical protein
MSKRSYIKVFASSFKNEDYCKAVIKWAPLIENTAYQTSKLVKQEYEDSLQSVLLDLAAMYDYFTSDLYRFKSRVWKLKLRNGPLALIECPDHVLDPMEPRWVSWSVLEPVKKCSANSFVYRRVVQHLPDTAVKHFRKKNGFTLLKEKRDVVVKTGDTRKVKNKVTFVPVQKHKKISMSEPFINIVDPKWTPEQTCVSNHMFDEASSLTKKVAKLIMSDGILGTMALARQAKLKPRQVCHAKAEMYRVLKKFRYPLGTYPVYFSAENVR